MWKQDNKNNGINKTTGLNRKLLIIFLCILAMLQLPVSVNAVSEEQTAAIQHILEDSCRISGVPGISVSIVQGEKIQYYSAGSADKETNKLCDKNTLYELASVSKAYTALGILLLELEGKLKLNDPIQTYLPWFTLCYEDNYIDMSDITLEKLLYHTSGLTNASHTRFIPIGNTPEMLKTTVENLVNAELDFYPGKQYAYGTVNYDILGLILEVISGKSYEDFVLEEIFQPLGLYNTYAYQEQASDTRLMAQGYRSSFLITKPYNSPDYRGNKPAGYLISSASDMGRWMQIQLGLVENIPEKYKLAVQKSHKANQSVSMVNSMYYAGGWEVNKDKTIIEHAGNNPSFTTQVILYPKQNIGICLLTNSNTANPELVHNIKDILDGNMSTTYHMGNMRFLDLFLTIATLLAGILAIVFFAFSLRRKKRTLKKKMRVLQIIKVCFMLTVTIFLFLICLFFPQLVGMNWSMLLSWQPGILSLLVTLFLLSASITFLVSMPRLK